MSWLPPRAPWGWGGAGPAAGAPSGAAASSAAAHSGATPSAAARLRATLRACFSSRFSTSLRSRLSFAIVVFRLPLEAIQALERLDVRGRGALRTLLRVEAHLRALGERLEAAALDRVEVDEQVLARLIGRDEAEALVVVEPLDGSCCHC